MKKLFLTTCVLLVLSVGNAATPTKKSVERLLMDMNVQQTIQTTLHQMDATMKNTMNQSFSGQKLSPEARQQSEKLEGKIMADFRDELSWQKTKRLYIRVYSETFTQKEVDGLIAFFEGPVGKAYVAKLPAVLKKTATLVQARMGPLMRRMRRDLLGSIVEVRAKQESGENQATQNPPGSATPSALGGSKAKGAGKSP